MKTVKYYYSKPLLFFNGCWNISTDDTVMSPKPHFGKRYTMAIVYDDVAHEIRFGLAICMPNDNFCKATGRKIASENAEKKPFFRISKFNGKRNDYVDEVMQVIEKKERTLLKKECPFLYNVNNIVSD